jgi:hypothetical protein
LHAIGGDGVQQPREFLAKSNGDPRRRFAETLIEALEAFDGPILVYSAYEKSRLKQLAGEFPGLSAPLNARSPGWWTCCQSCAAPSTSPNSTSATQ